MADEQNTEVQDDVTPELDADGIPEDIDLFPEEGGEPAPPPAKEPPAKEPPEKEPPEKEEPEKEEPEKEEPAKEPKDDEPKVPKSLEQMQERIMARDREVTQREHAVREAERWRRQAEEYEQFLHRAQQDPVSAFQAKGIDVQRLLGEKLGLEEPKSENETLKEQLAALQQRLDQREQNEQSQVAIQRRAAAQQRIMSRYEERAGQQPANDEEWAALEHEETPHLRAFTAESPAMLFDAAQTYAATTGQWLPDDEAARRAESTLQSQVKRVLEVARRMPQYREYFNSPTSGDSRTAKPAKASTPPQGSRKTLSQRDTVTPPPAGKPDDLVNASDEEVLAAGLAAFQGALQDD
jgi:hypothetical protein